MAEKTTREQVEELFDKGKEPKEIAEKLNVERATVYVHIRNIKKDRGIPVGGRGRPPKVQTDGAKPATETTRKAPPKAGQKATAETKAEAPVKAQTNGRDTGAEFPAIKKAIEQELHEARRRVMMLEKMYAPFAA